jgi:hypothetical protein
MLDLDAIEARAEAATPGPWRQTTSKRGYRDVLQTPDSYGDRMIAKGCPNADADFIAAARTDIPALVAELRAAREVVEAAAQRIGGSHAMVCDAYALGPGTTCDCGRDDLAAALAAYRAVVGEA